MIVIDKLDKYSRFFEVEGAHFIVASIYWDAYADLNSLVIFKDNLLSVYLSKRQIKRTNKEGLKFISDEESVNRYQGNFSEFLKISRVEFESSSTLQTGNSVKSFFERVFAFINYYRMTEFFYTDLAYLSTRNKNIKKNLKKIEAIKPKGRKMLNGIFLGSRSYLNRMLKSLSKKHRISQNKLLFYSYQELIDLHENNECVDNKILDKRIKCYLLLNVPKKKCTYSLRVINQYLPNKRVFSKILHGNTACKGIIEGYARVIEPNYDNFDQTYRFIKIMNVGEILIAESTSPELTLACKKAAAIVTNQGGIGSHAAIISREFGIPCIVGTEDATRRIKTGDYIRVNAQNLQGEISILESKV